MREHTIKERCLQHANLVVAMQKRQSLECTGRRDSHARVAASLVACDGSNSSLKRTPFLMLPLLFGCDDMAARELASSKVNSTLVMHRQILLRRLLSPRVFADAPEALRILPRRYGRSRGLRRALRLTFAGQALWRQGRARKGPSL